MFYIDGGRGDTNKKNGIDSCRNRHYRRVPTVARDRMHLSKTKILTLLIGVASIIWFPFWIQILDFFFPPVEFEDLWQPFDYHAHKNGYKAETHVIRTSDGYYIEFHHLWNPNVTGQQDSSPVVFSPLNFVNSKLLVIFNNSPPYIFADAGFDVWLLNHRGSSFGLKHATLDAEKDSSSFYNYTFVDFAQVDLPEQIEYVRKATGKPKIFFVTYSQAVMAFVALLAKKPESSDIFEKAIAYGGANCPCHMKHLSITVWVPYFGDLLVYSGRGHTGRFGALFLRFPYLNYLIGEGLGMHMSSLTEEQNKMLIEFRHEGVGIKALVHVAQNGLPGCDGLLREFDYDFGKTTELLMWLGLRGSRNMEVYGSPVPPVIDLEKFKFPIKFYWSQGDVWASGEIIKQFTKRVKVPSEDVHEIANENFDHFNFNIFNGKLHHIYHAVDFFKGKPTSWDPHVFDQYFTS